MLEAGRPWDRARLFLLASRSMASDSGLGGCDLLALVSSAHAGSLRRLSRASGLPLQGLAQGAEALRGRLSKATCRRLRELDVVLAFARHLTVQKVDQFLDALDAELAGGADGLSQFGGTDGPSQPGAAPPGTRDAGSQTPPSFDLTTGDLEIQDLCFCPPVSRRASSASLSRGSASPSSAASTPPPPTRPALCSGACSRSLWSAGRPHHALLLWLQAWRLRRMSGGPPKSSSSGSNWLTWSRSWTASGGVPIAFSKKKGRGWKGRSLSLRLARCIEAIGSWRPRILDKRSSSTRRLPDLVPPMDVFGVGVLPYVLPIDLLGVGILPYAWRPACPLFRPAG
uniref:Uncharacterized protein n=1 Tax=Alexandrium monilatum TaxID=311494 RepID=A0A7S4Q602_9DINO